MHCPALGRGKRRVAFDGWFVEVSLLKKSIGKEGELVYCGLGMPRKAGANAGKPHLVARWLKWSVFCV